MTSTSLPRPIPLYRPPLLRWIDTAIDHLATLHRRWQVRRATRAEWQRSAEVERALADLSPDTLRDIGAPQGLIGQRRWRDELEATQFVRAFEPHRW
jgi:hypothetical protein